jgi:hypothetical protein
MAIAMLIEPLQPRGFSQRVATRDCRSIGPTRMNIFSVLDLGTACHLQPPQQTRDFKDGHVSNQVTIADNICKF